VLYPPEKAAVEVDEAKQAEADARREDRDQREKAAITSMQGGERCLDRSRGVAENIPEQENQHAGGDRVEEPLDGAREPPNASDREPDEDGGTRDCAKGGRSSVAHVLRSGSGLYIVSRCEDHD